MASWVRALFLVLEYSDQHSASLYNWRLASGPPLYPGDPQPHCDLPSLTVTPKAKAMTLLLDT